MKKPITFIATLLAMYSYSQDFKIIETSDHSITTNVLKSGPYGFRIGITSNDGGVINQINLPGIGDIMRNASDRYGRAGQLAVRDASHGGRYNPTQAGFNEDIGTKCKITESEGKLTVVPRGVALWHGDKRYDFTQWENVGADPYEKDEGNSDVDGLDEKNLKGKQETEVFSEFDYYGTYEDFYGRNGIKTSVIRHYYELSFIREPGHCINQFREGTSIFNPKALRRDISKKAPAGVHKGTDKDMNSFLAAWTLRNDVNRWNFKFVYYKDSEGKWITKGSDNNIPANADQTVFIVAESDDVNKGRALCLFRPNTDINKFPIVGIDETNGVIKYRDDRIILNNEGTKINYSKFRTPAMSKYGFATRLSGMINRTRLANNVYESYRSEFYILYGTPAEIMSALGKINGIKLNQTITFPKLDEVDLNNKDFFPNASSDSRLPVKLISSNTNVATIKDGKIHIINPGKTTITASQEGNKTYNKANSRSRELVVSGATLSTQSFDSNNKKNKKLIFYPNPNNTRLLYLNNPDFWKIYSIDGRLIKEGEGNNINLRSFYPGIYLIKSDLGVGRLIIE